VLLVTSATQIHHLMQVAAIENLEDNIRSGLRCTVIASIGPIASQALESCGLATDLVPRHPKMGQLVFEAAQKAMALLQQKRRRIEPEVNAGG